MLKLEKLLDKSQMQDPLAQNNSVVVAKDDIGIVGYCIYSEIEECNIIKVQLVETDDGLADGLIRTAMFIAQQSGCSVVSYSKNIDTKLLLDYRLLNSETVSLRIGNINEILTADCSGKC